MNGDTTIRHGSLITRADKALTVARAKYASALAAYIRDPNLETTGAKFAAELALQKAVADCEQARMTFKQLKYQKVTQ